MREIVRFFDSRELYLDIEKHDSVLVTDKRQAKWQPQHARERFGTK